MFQKPKEKLGVGLNYRSEIGNEIVANLNHIDFVEINTERLFYDKNNQLVNKIIDNVPIVLHGLSLSIGTGNHELEPKYISNLANTLNKINCSWFSEHIAITTVQGLEIRALMPVEFTNESIDRIVKTAKRIQSLTIKPLLLENITYYYPMPNGYLTEANFINEIINKADCGLLLDVNNLYVNAINHQFDPYEFLDNLSLDHIVEVHLAGCNYINDMLVDTHASCIKNEVISLFKYLCKKTSINGVIIERDAKLNNFTELLDEIFLIREIYSKYN